MHLYICNTWHAFICERQNKRRLLAFQILHLNSYREYKMESVIFTKFHCCPPLDSPTCTYSEHNLWWRALALDFFRCLNMCKAKRLDKVNNINDTSVTLSSRAVKSRGICVSCTITANLSRSTPTQYRFSASFTP